MIGAAAASRRLIAIVLGISLLAASLLPLLSRDVLATLTTAKAPIVRTVQNRSGIITVDKSGAVYGNGAYDGRFNVDLVHDTNMILRPFSLSLFHPAPRDVLMIGLSSGSWAQVIANNPNVASLTVVELNPGYLQLVAEHKPVASVLSNPTVRIITDDGRRWPRLNPERRFDVIVSNTTWYYRANVTNLLSAEFLALVKDHLKPGGIFFYNTTDSARVQRTGCLGFSYGSRFTNHMVVSSAPIAWDFSRWRGVLEAYRIDGHPAIDRTRAADRARFNELIALEADLTAPPASDHYIEPCAAILSRTAGLMPVTDDNMGAEWRWPLGLD